MEKDRKLRHQFYMLNMELESSESVSKYYLGESNESYQMY